MQTHPACYPTDVTEEEWEQIQSLVPRPKSGEGKPGRPIGLSRRQLVNAIFYIVRSGCAWRLWPKDFGPWQTVYAYFRTGSRDWTWRFIHDTLRDGLRKTEGRNVAPPPPSLTANRSRRPTRPGNAAATRAKRCRGANDIWRSMSWA